MTVDLQRIHSAREYSPSVLADQKDATTISVCVPAKNEAETIGPIIDSIVTTLTTRTGDGVDLVDEVIVMDDDSTDATAEIAADAGAHVVRVRDVLPDVEPGRGKGNVLWKSIAASRGELIVWIDGDLRSFTPDYVFGLVGPLLNDSDVALVKGFYDRPEVDGIGGGRTTELMARPLLATFFPRLTGIRQPLGGEYASRRSILERLPLAQGYGVETALLIDIAELVGIERIAQVDLGVRAHRHRPLVDLTPQAMEVLHAVMHRVGMADRHELSQVLARPGVPTVDIHVAERPPLLDTPGYAVRED